MKCTCADALSNDISFNWQKDQRKKHEIKIFCAFHCCGHCREGELEVFISIKVFFFYGFFRLIPCRKLVTMRARINIARVRQKRTRKKKYDLEMQNSHIIISCFSCFTNRTNKKLPTISWNRLPFTFVSSCTSRSIQEMFFQPTKLIQILLVGIFFFYFLFHRKSRTKKRKLKIIETTSIGFVFVVCCLIRLTLLWQLSSYSSYFSLSDNCLFLTNLFDYRSSMDERESTNERKQMADVKFNPSANRRQGEDDKRHKNSNWVPFNDFMIFSFSHFSGHSWWFYSFDLLDWFTYITSILTNLIGRLVNFIFLGNVNFVTNTWAASGSNEFNGFIDSLRETQK